MNGQGTSATGGPEGPGQGDPPGSHERGHVPSSDASGRGVLDWLKWACVNAGERRLRAGWRILAQAVLLVIAVILLGVALAAAASVLAAVAPGAARQLRAPDAPAYWLVSSALGAISIAVTVWAARRLLDRRSFASLGLALDRRAALDVVAGFLIAGLMQTSVFVAEWALGWLRVERFAWEAHPPAQIVWGLTVMTIVFAMVGFYEELLSRGYWLQNASDGLNLFWGVVFSSSVFALLHLRNPNARLVAAAGIFGAGVFLGLAYARTRSLWLPIGLHFGWNLFEGPILGFPVSGVRTMVLIEQTVDGPVSWTGGAFGPEAGLIQLVPLTVGFTLVFWLTRGRGAQPAAGERLGPARV